MIENGFYDGLFEAVEDLLKGDSVFMVLDAPSGSGKTLCGISLLLVSRGMEDSKYFSKSKYVHLAARKIQLTVVHCIWPLAVDAQPIYKLIRDEQTRIGIQANVIFERAKYLDMSKVSDSATNIEKYVWFVVLRYIFKSPDESLGTDEDAFDVCEFRRSKNLGSSILFIFADEVPINPHEVQVIANLRDALKRVRGVAIGLAGTNSKAASMIGLSEASSVDLNVKPWALFMTRLPSFQISASHLRVIWDRTRLLVAAHKSDLTLAVNAIESSIRRGGNPRLISFAISVLASKVKEAGATFDAWQRNFAMCVTAAKFPFKTFSAIFPEMSGQLNLLLEASAKADLSDTMLAKHFAIRAVPDRGSKNGTAERAKLVDCAGWLYLSPASARCLGNSLNYVNKRLIQGTCMPEDLAGDLAWQTTVFPPVHSDILVYLGTCRERGFFDPACSHVLPFLTYQIVSSCWKSNVAGLVNFQNPDAENNPGTKLEVTVAAAVCNAAAVKGSTGYFFDYLHLLAMELGVQVKAEVLATLEKDSAFKFPVPRFLLPGIQLDCEASKLIGLVKRIKNEDEFDVRLSWHGEEPVHIEVKDRKKFRNGDLWTFATKLFASKARVGLLIVRNCCNYWRKKGNSRDNSGTNKARVKKFLENLNTEKVGMVYFLRADGTLDVLELGTSDRRMVLIQALS